MLTVKQLEEAIKLAKERKDFYHAEILEDTLKDLKELLKQDKRSK